MRAAPLRGVVLLASAVLLFACMDATTKYLTASYAVPLVVAVRYIVHLLLMVIILVDKQDLKTVPLAFYETFRTSGGYVEVQYGLVAAMGVLYLLPVMAVFFATRRLMVRGLVSGTKGP